jgi:hypothetical protein
VSERNDGGPAFPVIEGCPTKGIRSTDGLSLRDWFAGMALQGLLASRHASDTEDTEDVSAVVYMEAGGLFLNATRGAEDYSRIAYELADAMLAINPQRTEAPDVPRPSAAD